MDFKILIKPIVFVDAEEAVMYYEKKLPGLGKRFYEQFLITLNKIHAKPHIFSFVKGSVRRCRIEKFPYKIFYLIQSDTIFIIGLSHAKRSNTFIKRRLKMV
ncbi:MAG: hypothetical protein V4717_01630 [Bacteroidota bacterium]